MAAAAGSVSSMGAQFLPLPCKLATTKIQIASMPRFSKMRFHSLRLQTRRKLVLRCSRTESKGVSLGFRAPNFELPEPLTGKVWKLEDFEPYPALLKGLAVIAISSNSVTTHPQDGPECMVEDVKTFNYPFPYVYDESQEVARDFGAVCTPEFFLLKKDGRRPFELVYHGQFDDSRPSNNVPVTGRDLSFALDCALSGQPVSLVQKPSVGCSIKWHPETKL